MKMKRLFACLLLMVCFSLFARAGYCLQGGGGEEGTKKTPTKSSGPKTPPKSTGGKVTAPAPVSTPVAVVGDVTIVSTPSVCEVLLDGESKGRTNSEGFLTLTKLKPGHYSVTLRKPTYQDYKGGVDVVAGQKIEGRFSLNLMPGKLNVTSTQGAQISITGAGSYTSSINDLELAAGHYEVVVSGSGFHTTTRGVDIEPEKTAGLNIPLEPLSPSEILTQAEQNYAQRRYDETIAASQKLMTTPGSEARANYLIGSSYYNQEKYAESVSFLNRAISLGETVTLTIKHHHQRGFNDDLCSGTLVLKKGTVEFHSATGDHDFSVPLSKVYELSPEPNKAGRIHLKVGIPKGDKEDKKNYNFHVTKAYLAPFQPGDPNTIIVARCNNCFVETQAIFQLLQHLKQ